MGFFANRTLGLAAALMGACGLLVSCNTSAPSSTHVIHAAVAPDKPAARLDISDTFEIADLEKRFEEVARQAAPSVVAISATDAKIDADESLRSNRINPDKLAALLEPVDRTVGTGFIVDSDGYIVTNDHVVASTDHIWVTTDDHRVFPAVVVGSDPRCDLAVLKIPATNLPTVHFSAAPARRGQWTLALGNPYGLAGGGQMALSVGVVSATGRSLPKLSSKEDRLYSDLIQTTAQINPGNSGGPLFDLHGDVIGINAAVILPQKSTNGIGFAIPITARVRQTITDLKEGREVVYGWLGVRVTSATPLECKAAGVGCEGGAKVESIETDSPAAAAKLRVGDVITIFNGMVVTDSDQFVRLVGEAPIERHVTVVIYRDGKAATLDAATARRKPQQFSVTRESQRMRWRGMLLGPIPQHWNAGSSPRPAGLLVIAIEPASPFVKEGVSQGCIIATVAGKPVGDVLQLQRILNETPPDACGIGLAKAAGQVVSVQE
jgi:S1-C subfamily serine protease